MQTVLKYTPADIVSSITREKLNHVKDTYSYKSWDCQMASSYYYIVLQNCWWKIKSKKKGKKMGEKTCFGYQPKKYDFAT